MIKLYYFSPTGNTEYIATKVQQDKSLGIIEKEPIEGVKTFDLDSFEQILIAFSVHAFNAPRPVKQFVKALPP